MSVESGVLVFHCSDPRYQAGFHDFLRNELGLERYALVAVPGGPQFLTLSEFLPKFAWTGWRWVKFLGNLGNARRVVLIAHEDCRWYMEGLFGASPGNLREKQLKDLQHAAAGLRERFPNIAPELYYARMDDGKAVFEKVG
jgi:hypothetical protein